MSGSCFHKWLFGAEKDLRNFREMCTTGAVGRGAFPPLVCHHTCHVTIFLGNQVSREAVKLCF